MTNFGKISRFERPGTYGTKRDTPCIDVGLPMRREKVNLLLPLRPQDENRPESILRCFSK